MDECSVPDGTLFLGLDVSTQSLKATVLNSELVIVASETVHFDSELSHYVTKDGVYRDPSDDRRIVSPTLMWVESLDLLLEKLSKSHIDLRKIAAVSGSGQQHGSVYWRKGSASKLASLDHRNRLVDQLRDAFSLTESPIWMDSSTTKQCQDIEKAMGGALELARLTGSRAHERFTGPQIRKIYETCPDVYRETERISLVSSFMASLLIGTFASIDQTDAAGMNLMNLRKRVWSESALEATAPDLEEKLGQLKPSHAVAGPISLYFVKRFNFSRECVVIQWSGDNPNSLAGMTLNAPGDLGISLGTSDTVFGITSDPKPSLEGHVFPNPVDAGGYMIMLVYKNGSLTREDVRDRYAGKSWEIFNKYLHETAPLNGGKMGFYYREHEILPPLPAGIHRYRIKGDGYNRPNELEMEEEARAFDPPSEVRALVEGQHLSMRAHTEAFGMPSPPSRIVATGGASANKSILKSIASVFGCDVHTVQRPDSASLGAALRAAHGWLCSRQGKLVPISGLYEHKMEKTSLARTLAVAGDQCMASKYTGLMGRRSLIENLLVQKLGHH